VKAASIRKRRKRIARFMLRAIGLLTVLVSYRKGPTRGSPRPLIYPLAGWRSIPRPPSIPSTQWNGRSERPFPSIPSAPPSTVQDGWTVSPANGGQFSASSKRVIFGMDPAKGVTYLVLSTQVTKRFNFRSQNSGVRLG